MSKKMNHKQGQEIAERIARAEAPEIARDGGHGIVVLVVCGDRSVAQVALCSPGVGGRDVLLAAVGQHLAVAEPVNVGPKQ